MIKTGLKINSKLLDKNKGTKVKNSSRDKFTQATQSARTQINVSHYVSYKSPIVQQSASAEIINNDAKFHSSFDSNIKFVSSDIASVIENFEEVVVSDNSSVYDAFKSGSFGTFTPRTGILLDETKISKINTDSNNNNFGTFTPRIPIAGDTKISKISSTVDEPIKNDAFTRDFISPSLRPITTFVSDVIPTTISSSEGEKVEYFNAMNYAPPPSVPIVLDAINKTVEGNVNISITPTILDDSITGRFITKDGLVLGNDIYNLDNIYKDLRSYNGELLNSFDQVETVNECELIAIIHDKENDKILIPFMMKNFSLFYVKVFDMFYDRNLFLKESTVRPSQQTIDYLWTDFYSSDATKIVNDFKGSQALQITRTDAKIFADKNKDVLKRNGIDIGLTYTIFGDSDEIRDKAKQYLEIGCFEHEYNEFVQDDNVFIYKIYPLVWEVPMERRFIDRDLVLKV